MAKLPFVEFVYLLALVCLPLSGCGQQAGSTSAAQTQSTPSKSEASTPVATAASVGKTGTTPQPATPSPATKPTATQAQTGATTAAKSRITAREAWRLVEPEVQKWQKGAKIAIGGPSAASKDFDLFDGKASEWRFTCAPPDEQQFWAFYVNTAGEQPKFRSGQASRPAVTAMTDPASWQIDSPRAYEIAMANGLKEWLAEHSSFSGKDATMELRGLKEIGSYWLIVCHHDKKTIEFQISATDGKVHLANSH